MDTNLITIIIVLENTLFLYLLFSSLKDLKNATSSENIGAAFGLPELSRQNKIAVYPLEMPPGLETCNKSVNTVKNIVVNLCCGE